MSEKPIPLSAPDFSKLQKVLEEQIEYCNKQGYINSEKFDHSVFEAAVEAVYGKAFWDWYNRILM